MFQQIIIWQSMIQMEMMTRKLAFHAHSVMLTLIFMFSAAIWRMTTVLT
uniref:Uncharacterized protein n=1 Tax=Rhizophora mucronata TaxID=61149 RepID=A0A2P2KLS6_RHIMU